MATYRIVPTYDSFFGARYALQRKWLCFWIEIKSNMHDIEDGRRIIEHLRKPIVGIES